MGTLHILDGNLVLEAWRKSADHLQINPIVTQTRNSTKLVKGEMLHILDKINDNEGRYSKCK